MFRKRYLVLTLLAALVLACGCAAPVKRTPLPEAAYKTAQIPGIRHARIWGDEPPGRLNREFLVSSEDLKIIYATVAGKKSHILALSGGGSNGAFGAGFLSGWSDKKTRPEFFVVTGISAGALIAPFAYLGSDLDPFLEAMWTGYGTEDVLSRRSLLSFLTRDAMADSSPLRRLVRHYLNADLIEKIAHEYREKRRLLLIGTTNLDAMRPMIWNIGEIAASAHPEKEALIYDILVASASIPGLYPPVYIEVASDGKIYDEIHVDGGTASQVFVYPPGIDWDRAKELLEITGKPRLYILRNAKLAPEWEAVPPKVDAIVGRSVSSLIRTQGLGDLYRIYLDAIEDRMDFNLVYIEDDFTLAPDPKEIFDRTYMRALFQYGHALGLKPDKEIWKKAPPRMHHETR